MSETSPFPPFMPTTTPEPPAAKPETAKQKEAREKREVKAAAKALSPLGKAISTPAAKPPRKKRNASSPKLAKRAPKYDLQTILRVAATLKEGDQGVFEKLLGVLSDLSKASRGRVMKALSEVFG